MSQVIIDSWREEQRASLQSIYQAIFSVCFYYNSFAKVRVARKNSLKVRIVPEGFVFNNPRYGQLKVCPADCCDSQVKIVHRMKSTRHHNEPIVFLPFWREF